MRTIRKRLASPVSTFLVLVLNTYSSRNGSTLGKFDGGESVVINSSDVFPIGSITNNPNKHSIMGRIKEKAVAISN